MELVDAVALEFKKDGESVFFCIRESDLERFRQEHGNDIAGGLKVWKAPMGVCDDPEDSAIDLLVNMTLMGFPEARKASYRVVFLQ